MSPRLSYFEALRRVSREFNSTQEKNKILDLVVETVQELLEVKGVALFLTDEATNSVIPVAQRGLSDDYMQNGLTRVSKMRPHITRDGYLFARDAASDERLDNSEAKRREGIASMLVVPIIVQEELVGALGIFTAETKEFTEDEIEFVTALAEQGGIAIEHARLVDRLRENNRLILEFTTNVNSSLDIKKVLHILAAEIADYLEVKGSSVLLFDETNESLEFVTGYGLSTSYANRQRLIIEESVRQTLEGNTVFIEDALTDDRVKHKREKEQEGIVSILSVPIKTKSQVIGALRLYCGDRRRFTEDETYLIQALAYIGGLAIQNASMYLRLQQDISDLQADIWSHRMYF
jgi:GAF domain-containing protein